MDTSAFVALADRADQHHASAARFIREQVTPADQLHTSNYVLDETITRLRVSAGYRAAAAFAEKAFTTRSYQRHVVDADVEADAFRVFTRYSDHDLSFTDCTTIVWLERLSITQVFAYDRAFQAVGYQLVPGIPA